MRGLQRGAQMAGALEEVPGNVPQRCTLPGVVMWVTTEPLASNYIPCRIEGISKGLIHPQLFAVYFATVTS